MGRTTSMSGKEKEPWLRIKDLSLPFISKTSPNLHLPSLFHNERNARTSSDSEETSKPKSLLATKPLGRVGDRKGEELAELSIKIEDM